MNEVGIVISGWQDTSPELARIRHPPHTDGYKAGMRWSVDGPLLRCGAPWSLAVQAAAVLEHGAMGSLGHHAPFHGIHQDADESEASALSRGWSAPQGFDRWSRSTSTDRSGSSGWTATVTGPMTSAEDWRQISCPRSWGSHLHGSRSPVRGGRPHGKSSGMKRRSVSRTWRWRSGSHARLTSVGGVGPHVGATANLFTCRFTPT